MDVSNERFIFEQTAPDEVVGWAEGMEPLTEPCTCDRVVLHYSPITEPSGEVHEVVQTIHEATCTRFRRRWLKAV